MLEGDLFHKFHRQLVVVRGDVGHRKDRSELMLCRSHFVVFGLGVNTELPKFRIQVLHESTHAGLEGSEVMIFHLLSARRRGAEKGPSGVHQIFAGIKKSLVNKKILLLWADRALDSACFNSEKF